MFVQCCCSSLNVSSKPSVFYRQILVYEGEMERAQGQLEVEMQSLEEEKNREIEEAFIRAESEMKAVHENLAGQFILSSVLFHIFTFFSNLPFFILLCA